MEVKDILLVLIGGICSSFGGFLAVLYRSKVAGKVKLQETIAERKVSAYGKGLELIDQIQSILVKRTHKDTLDFLYRNASWFADNRILLPHTFVENWRSIRQNLKKAIMKDKVQDKMQDGDKRENLVNQITEAFDFCIKLAEEAEGSIRKELNLPEYILRQLPNSRTDKQVKD